MYEYGELIEKRRRPITENRVFSYRFLPTEDGVLYGNKTAWTDFWNACLEKSKNYNYVAYLDIADFYNQIYHHVIENQLIKLGFPNQILKSVLSLLESLTQGVSRGIPVGPHSTHILAEMSLIPIDNGLSLRNYDFCRYADDIVIFCDKEIDARIAIYQLAEILDKQQRLILQKQKTTIHKISEFREICLRMLNDNPINIIEEKMLKVLKKYSSGNPYTQINIKRLNKDELDLFSKEAVEELIKEYIQPYNPNYSRLRWFYRRLSQVGTPDAVEFSIKNMDKLIPAISDVCHYLISTNQNYDEDWNNIGEEVFSLLSNELIKSNEFFQISLLSLFVSNNKLNHFDKLITLFKSSSENIKRKIILAAYKADATS